MKYNILYFGTWGYGKAGLEALNRINSVNIKTVYSKWDVSIKNDYLNSIYYYAKSNDINIINSSKENLSKKKFEESIMAHSDIDFIISCCYDRIFSNKILSFPRILSVNIHPSILPSYKGIKPLENALANGEKETGVTLHELTSKLDSGDILIQKKFNFSKSDKYGDIYLMQCELIKEVLTEFYANLILFISKKTKQEQTKESLAPRLPFSISDFDTQEDIMKKYQEFKQEMD